MSCPARNEEPSNSLTRRLPDILFDLTPKCSSTSLSLLTPTQKLPKYTPTTHNTAHTHSTQTLTHKHTLHNTNHFPKQEKHSTHNAIRPKMSHTNLDFLSSLITTTQEPLVLLFWIQRKHDPFLLLLLPLKFKNSKTRNHTTHYKTLPNSSDLLKNTNLTYTKREQKETIKTRARSWNSLSSNGIFAGSTSQAFSFLDSSSHGFVSLFPSSNKLDNTQIHKDSSSNRSKTVFENETQNHT